MSGVVRLLAAALPLAGLAGLWALSDHTYRQGTEWAVPVEGYDPRDLLRGHYIQFTYDWPGLADDTAGPPPMLCLEGAPPALARVSVPADEAALADCAYPLRAQGADIYGWQGLMRGRLYLDQDRARALDAALRDPDQRGIVTIRQREDGSFTPISIRFRPLTPAERAARDADSIRPAAPPIMAEPAAGTDE